uniref:Uncharacterized LOC100179982 n=1 Tax=Ciona intestinalis TaxID=7719 RepID=H2XM99_CIOIN|nr:uncharacterized protein LOC100179982 [Ciona intestinalis]XP_026690772.1 uncharacterized protein LOC100179982 [Ciona intestinalis]|eukprot:XP_002129138.1 uncharacterized protein LOC100179982 [Ciona intestinalis]
MSSNTVDRNNRVESQIPRIFNKYIKECNAGQWLKFIRILGLSEHDIQNHRMGNDMYEWKYRMLDRWKMVVGNRTDVQYEAYLKEALDEIDLRTPSNLQYDYSTLNQNKRFAQVAYNFIDRHSSNFLSIMNEQLHEYDIRHLKDEHHDNNLEMMYQMILKLQKSQRMSNEEMENFFSQNHNRSV